MIEKPLFRIISNGIVVIFGLTKSLQKNEIVPFSSFKPLRLKEYAFNGQVES